MATYTSTPIKAAKSESPNTPNMNSNNNTLLYVVIFVAVLGFAGYGWTSLDKRVSILEAANAARPVATARALTQPRGGGAAGAAGVAGALGANGPGAMGAGRRGGNGIAGIFQQLGLDPTDPSAVQLTALATQRTQVLQQAQADATAQGVTRQQDPQGYQTMMDLATADIDGQISAINPDVLTALQAQGNQGRRGGAGAAGAAGAMGRRGGG